MQTQTYRITVNYRQALASQQWANEYLLQLEITSAQNAILTLVFRSHMHCVTPRQIAEQGVHRGCPSIIGHTPSCVVTFPVRAQLCPSPRLYYQRIHNKTNQKNLGLDMFSVLESSSSKKSKTKNIFLPYTYFQLKVHIFLLLSNPFLFIPFFNSCPLFPVEHPFSLKMDN